MFAGGNAELSGEIQVGDVILACGVSADAMIEGSNFDEVMDALGMFFSDFHSCISLADS